MFPLLLAAALGGAPESAVVARVEGDPITVGELAARAQGAGLPPLGALETLVRERVVARAARTEGLDRAPELRAALETARRQVAAERLLEDEVFSRLRASDAEVLEAFHATNDQVRLSLVVRSTEAEAAEALARLRAGAALIEEGRDSSDPVVAAKAGVLGWVPRTALAPPLARAAFSAPILEPVGPVPVPKGWAVVLVHERRLGDEPHLGEREALRRMVRRGKRDEAAARFTARIAARRKARPGEERRALEDEAVARGLGQGPAVARALGDMERDLLVRAYLSRLTGPGEPTAEEVEARWRARPAEWTLPPRRACIHVVTQGEPELRRLRARLEAGAPVEEVAREAAAIPGAHAGTVELTQAELDEMARPGNDEALAAAVVRSSAGHWTEPFHGRRGWTAFRCEAPRPAELVPLERARAAVAERLRRERAEHAVDDAVARLRRAAVVQVDEGVLGAALAAPP
jgi:parvulin-like peptidyl-prolyl isomerase